MVCFCLFRKLSEGAFSLFVNTAHFCWMDCKDCQLVWFIRVLRFAAGCSVSPKGLHCGVDYFFFSSFYARATVYHREC